MTKKSTKKPKEQADPFEQIGDVIKNADALALPEKEGEAPTEKTVEELPDPDEYRAKVLADCGLSEFLPIIPLGKRGMIFHYLDDLSQLISLSARDHSRNNLSSLMGTQNELLPDLWPAMKEVTVEDEDGNKTKKFVPTGGFKADKVADDLMRASAKRGVFDPSGALRGLGCWRRDDGSPIWHCGDALIYGNRDIRPSEIDDKVYPGLPKIARPYEKDEPAGSAGGVAQELYELLQTWNFERGKTDAMLMLGWIGAAFISGALKFRPMAFLTGDATAGKSKLQELIIFLFNETGIVHAADTTAAGIYQTVGYSCLPVAIDELEADADNKRVYDVMKLARLSSSGAVMLRGGQDHNSMQFEARSCFLFSSILIPDMSDAEKSRMAILSLKQLPKDAVAPVLSKEKHGLMGRKLQRRLMQGFDRLDETILMYEDAVRRAGHGQRTANQFGALLACADLLLFNDVPDTDTLDHWTKTMDVKGWAETADIRSSADRCLDWLLQAMPDMWRGGAKENVYKHLVNIQNAKGDEGGSKTALASFGLAHVKPRNSEQSFLAVHQTHLGLQEIFKGSEWAGKRGRTGIWVQALARLPGAERDKSARIGGKPDKCVLIPMSVIMRDEIEAVGDAENEILG